MFHTTGSEDQEDQFLGYDNDQDEFARKQAFYNLEVMQDEGVADWTLQQEEQKYAFKRERRIKNKDVAFLMRVRSRIEFESDEDHVTYLKAKLKDIAHNNNH